MTWRASDTTDTAFIVLARHGDTKQPDAENRYTSRPGPPLTPMGKAHAKRLGGALRPFEISGLYSSDLPRALQTAAIVADEIGVAITPLAAFREIYSGALNGATLEEVERLHPRFLPWIHAGHHQGFPTTGFHVPHNLAFPDGESVSDMGGRATAAFAEISRTSLGSLSVIVSHAWVTQVLISHVLGVPIDTYFRFASAYAATSVVQVDATGRGILHCLNAAIPLEELARGSLPRRESTERIG